MKPELQHALHAWDTIGLPMLADDEPAGGIEACVPRSLLVPTRHDLLDFLETSLQQQGRWHGPALTVTLNYHLLGGEQSDEQVAGIVFLLMGQAGDTQQAHTAYSAARLQTVGPNGQPHMALSLWDDGLPHKSFDEVKSKFEPASPETHDPAQGLTKEVVRMLGGSLVVLSGQLRVDIAAAEDDSPLLLDEPPLEFTQKSSRGITGNLVTAFIPHYRTS